MGLHKHSAKITKEIKQRSGLRERGRERPARLLANSKMCGFSELNLCLIITVLPVVL